MADTKLHQVNLKNGRLIGTYIEIEMLSKFMVIVVFIYLIGNRNYVPKKLQQNTSWNIH